MGKLLGETLAAAGARVVLWDVDRQNLDATVAALHARGHTGTRGYTCDVGDVHAVNDTAAKASAAPSSSS
jgi:NAD(P)-dependent dehydrogenase (short-subunit alcohol dehydrogenase family)